jgi:hypothetical protein
MHEGYLRAWAIQTGITILSVDYRLAPQYKFPTAIEECFYVYKWLITTCGLGKKCFQVGAEFVPRNEGEKDRFGGGFCWWEFGIGSCDQSIRRGIACT